jgi:hypothetical protein
MSALGVVFALLLRPARAFDTTPKESLPLKLKRVMALDNDAARAIFAAYVEQTPEERDRDYLLRSFIGADAAWLNSTERQADVQLRNRVMQRIRDDFGCGNTIELEGWVLSRTEARLCGIVATA